MLKILQVRLQKYMNQEVPDVQAEFRKGRGTRDQTANICWIIEKAREFQENTYFALLTTPKPLNVGSQQTGKFFKGWEYQKTKREREREMGIPDHLISLLRNLYAGQEATVRTGYGKTDWFQIGKGVHQGCILSPCLFNVYAEYIMRNAGLDEAQVGIKIGGEISITSDTQVTPPLWQKVKRS